MAGMAGMPETARTSQTKSVARNDTLKRSARAAKPLREETKRTCPTPMRSARAAKPLREETHQEIR